MPWSSSPSTTYSAACLPPPCVVIAAKLRCTTPTDTDRPTDRVKEEEIDQMRASERASSARAK